MDDIKRILIPFLMGAAAVLGSMGVLGFMKAESAPTKMESQLRKVWDKQCALFRLGESYPVAKVESRSLCDSIARAYNYARTADRPEQEQEFGLCWHAYHFECEGWDEP